MELVSSITKKGKKNVDFYSKIDKTKLPNYLPKSIMYIHRESVQLFE